MMYGDDWVLKHEIYRPGILLYSENCMFQKERWLYDYYHIRVSLFQYLHNNLFVHQEL